MLDLIDLSRVGDFASANRSELVHGQRNHRQRLTVKCHELNLTTASRVDQYHRGYVASLETNVREIGGEHHNVMFANHRRFLPTGYTVTSFCAYSPRSMNQTDRTTGLRPSGVASSPSKM